MTSQPATPGASGTPMDLIGKTVRWDDGGQWFTARALRSNGYGGYVGRVVDPGNFVSLKARSEPWLPGDHVPHLEPALCTVIDSEPVTEDEECE